MKKLIFSLCCFLMIFACACSEKKEQTEITEDLTNETSNLENTEEIISENSTVQYGWFVNAQNQIYRVGDNLKEAELVLELSDISDISGQIDTFFINEECAFLSYFSDLEEIVVMYTGDSGRIWNKTFVPYKEYGGPNETFLSFVDENIGYLLYCSDPAAGKMNKILFISKDGGKTFQEQAELSTVIRNQPEDMLFFTETCGFMTTINYGEEAYLYQTEDAGITWNPIALEVPKKEEFSYINGVAIEKVENSNQQAKLTLKGVGGEEECYFEFVTKDMGETWELVK